MQLLCDECQTRNELKIQYLINYIHIIPRHWTNMMNECFSKVEIELITFEIQAGQMHHHIGKVYIHRFDGYTKIFHKTSLHSVKQNKFLKLKKFAIFV